MDFILRYPFNNFLHHHVENIIGSCLESKQDQLIGHVLDECKLVTRILEAEKNSALSTDLTKVKKFAFISIFTYGSSRLSFICVHLYFSCSIHYLQRENLHQG
jgi:hypothetical protein